MKQAIKIGIIAALLIGISFSAYAEDFNQQLLLAVENLNVAEVKELISKGADVDTKDKDGRTPLFEALSQACYGNDLGIFLRN